MEISLSLEQTEYSVRQWQGQRGEPRWYRQQVAELYPEDNQKYSSLKATGEGIGIKGFKWKERAEGGVDFIKERTEVETWEGEDEQVQDLTATGRRDHGKWLCNQWKTFPRVFRDWIYPPGDTIFSSIQQVLKHPGKFGSIIQKNCPSGSPREPCCRFTDQHSLPGTDEVISQSLKEISSMWDVSIACTVHFNWPATSKITVRGQMGGEIRYLHTFSVAHQVKSVGHGRKHVQKW